MPAQLSDDERQQYLSSYANYLRSLDAVQPLFFHPREDYDDNQQLKPGIEARSGVQWNLRAEQSFEQAASHFSGHPKSKI
jgi:NAD(P)H dehydrogenase (quinone)